MSVDAQDGDLNTTLTRAATSLSVTATHADPKPSAAGVAGAIVGAIDAETKSTTIQAFTPIATQTFQAVQGQLDRLGFASTALTNALDKLGELHPFVLVVVTAFKVAWKFEVTRRQNDKRVLMLNLKMNDMLSVLLLLKDIARGDRGSDGTSIADRLSGRMKTIARDIENSAAVCDTFSKKRTVVKLFRSLEWESKLTGFMDMFDAHKKNLESDLALHTSIGIVQANVTLAAVSARVQSIDASVSMALLLQQLRSPEERSLMKKIEQRGGPERVLNDETLLRQLITEAGEKDAPLPGTVPTAQKDVPPELVKEIVRETSRSFDEMVKENEELFSRKFRAQEIALREDIDAATRREGDRIIGVFTSGPHDRILDHDLYEVWKESGWKGTTKARSLVMALREHYAERYKRISNEHQTTEDSRTKEPGGTSVGVEDAWALQYITIQRIQPLLEAFDDDASSLVSISEVNAFTSARPKNWSLPHWMAYWTAGYPLVLKHYFTRIHVILSRIITVVKDIHQTNRTLADYFLSDYWSSDYMDKLFAGVHKAVQDIDQDYGLFGRFQDYVEAEEAKMKAKLEAVKYCIDAENTLNLVTSSGRLEKHVLPLIYLLLLRTLHVIRHARDVPVHPDEFKNIMTSLDNIWFAIRRRVNDVKATCKLQNLDIKEQLRKFSYGIYYYYEHDVEAKKTDYIQNLYRTYSWDHLAHNGLEFSWGYLDACPNTRYEDLDVCNEELRGPLLYPSPEDSLHLEVYDEPQQCSLPLLDPDLPSTWSGSHLLKQFDGSFANKSSAGVMHLSVPPAGTESGPVTGGGTDYTGDFVITGTLEGSRISFTKRYGNIEPRCLRFQGVINTERNEISGSWVASSESPNADANVIVDVPFGEADIQGRFEYRIAPTGLSFIQPDAEALVSNRPRALWRFAYDAIKHLLRIRRGQFSWDYLQARRRARRRFLQLFDRLSERSSAWPSVRSRPPLTPEESEELAAIVAVLPTNDFRFYKQLSSALQRRRVIHWGLSCDGCSEVDMETTRYTCLECLQVDSETGLLSDTVDLCEKCVDKPAHRIRDNMDHVPTHAMLRIRRTAQWKMTYASIKFRRDALKKLRDEDAGGAEVQRHCDNCAQTLEPPFWLCNDCADVDVLICRTCREQLEEHPEPSPVCSLRFLPAQHAKADNNSATKKGEGPATSDTANGATAATVNDKQDGAKDESGSVPAAKPDEKAQIASASPHGIVAQEEKKTREHQSWHSLILYTASPKKIPPAVSVDAVGEHLTALQGKVASIEMRMERLEQMLMRALGLAGEPT